MTTKAKVDPANRQLTTTLSRVLGVRRSARLRAVMRLTGLPPEILLDLAIELLHIASRKLSPRDSTNGSWFGCGEVAECERGGAQSVAAASRAGAMDKTPP